MSVMSEFVGLLGCVENADLYQNPLLEEPSTAQTVEQRRTQATLLRKAENQCLDCPLMVECLYRAVTEYDVAGFCAGTTQRQRQEIRRRLGIRVEPEDFDSFAGAASSHQVNHNELLRLRKANPTASLDSIAQRLGCSLSTVKRHLRKARRGESVGRKPKLAQVLPSSDQVLDAYHDVVNTRTTLAPRKAA